MYIILFPNFPLVYAGNWKDKFDPEHTRKAPFYLNDTDSVEVEMMFKEEKYPMGYDKDTKTQVRERSFMTRERWTLMACQVLMSPIKISTKLIHQRSD